MIVKAKIFPGSGKNSMVKKDDGSFEIKVKAKPIKGMASKAAIILLSDYFKVPVSKIRLIKGFRERNKVFKIE